MNQKSRLGGIKKDSIRTKNALELINEVLDYSKIEAGAAELQEEIVDVSDIIESVIRMIGDRATKQGVELIVVAEDKLPRLRADAKKIRQILLDSGKVSHDA